MKSKPKPADDGLPTVDQLAPIAATLARNLRETPEALANKAMEIWLATRRRINDAAESDEIKIEDYALSGSSSLSLSEAFYRKRYDFYPDGEIPITRDQILRAALPTLKRRAGKLREIAKEYLIDSFPRRRGKEPSPAVVDEAYANWESFDDPMAAIRCAEDISSWYSRRKSKRKRIGGLESAAKRKADRESGLSPKRKKRKTVPQKS